MSPAAASENVSFNTVAPDSITADGSSETAALNLMMKRQLPAASPEKIKAEPSPEAGDRGMPSDAVGGATLNVLNPELVILS